MCNGSFMVPLQSITEKYFEFWGVLKMATVKSVQLGNIFFMINHIIRCRSKLLSWCYTVQFSFNLSGNVGKKGHCKLQETCYTLQSWATICNGFKKSLQSLQELQSSSTAGVTQLVFFATMALLKRCR